MPKFSICKALLASMLLAQALNAKAEDNFHEVKVNAINMVPAVIEVMPIYPKSMRKKAIDGVVTLSYTIDKKGKAIGFKVVGVEPNRIFVRSAMIALQKTQFQVTEINGKPQIMRDQQRSYVYNASLNNTAIATL